MNKKVLILQDEGEILNHFATVIEDSGFEVLTPRDGQHPADLLEGSIFLVVITDLVMPRNGGLEILKEIKRHHPATRLIIITGVEEQKDVINLEKLGAFDYVEKGNSESKHKLLRAIERAFQDEETQSRVEKEMLSFLTHTLFASISGGPETVEQVLDYAQHALGERFQENDVYKMISNIASLKAIFLSMANMLHAYKIFVSDPDNFRRKWEEDRGGEIPLDSLLAAVLRQTLGTLLFEETNLAQLRRLLALHEGNSLVQVRQTFLQDVFWSETLSSDTQRVLEWAKLYLPVISLEIDGPDMSFHADGIRYPFLFAILSEIVYNALKYSNGKEAIRIRWSKEGDAYAFSCRNTFDETSTRRVGSQKGLSFVSGLTNMVDGIQLACTPKQDCFTVQLCMKDSILDGGAI